MGYGISFSRPKSQVMNCFHSTSLVTALITSHCHSPCIGAVSWLAPSPLPPPLPPPLSSPLVGRTGLPLDIIGTGDLRATLNSWERPSTHTDTQPRHVKM